MKLDLGSFCFNGEVASGGNTPSWGTALGQGKDYKITCEDGAEIVLGMTRQFSPKEYVYCPLGKGGRICNGRDSNEIQQVALFKKVYVNDTRIDYPFILLIQVEQSEYHSGRLNLKYSPKIYIQENNVLEYSNEKFIDKVYETFNISKDACWFVYDLCVVNQDTLILSAVFVDEFNPKVYASAEQRKREWIELIPEEKKTKYVAKPSSSELSSLQQIYYGAPGTGKSYKVNELTRGESVVRTTFHPDSDYSTFVGAYKPCSIDVPKRDVTNKVTYENGEKVTEKCIIYEFVPQAFLLAYVKAWKMYEDVQNGENAKMQYLIIEEINRGNCAQIFGDLFQLLDRDEYGFSKYYVHADSDVKAYLTKELEGLKIFQKEQINDCCGEDVVDRVLCGEILLLPSNLSILATMNTSDQSLFPIDSAFKRRWDWEYVPIAKGVDGKTGKEFNWKIVVGTIEYDWWDFLAKINEQIGTTTNSEDKKLGFFFCQAKNNVIDAETFVSKVLFYLWNDVFKDYGFDGELFKGADNETLTFDKFYNVVMGEVVPNLENVKQFLKNLKVDPRERDSVEDVDEEDESIVDQKDKKGKKQNPLYMVGGEGAYDLGGTIIQAVRRYIELNPRMSPEEVVRNWNALKIRFAHKKENNFMTEVEHQKWLSEHLNDTKKDTRYKQLSVGDSQIWVTTQIVSEDMNDFIEKVSKQNWGIDIEKVQE